MSSQITIAAALKQPAPEIAAWAIDRAGDLGTPGAEAGCAPAMELAAEFGRASAQQRQALLSHAIAGFQDLPLEKRVAGVRLAVKVTKAVQEPLAKPQVDTPLPGNVARLRESAKFSALPEREVQAMVENIRAELPQQLVRTVAGLTWAEREELAELLVESPFVPADQRALVQDAVLPGGYVNKATFGMVGRVVDFVRDYWSFLLLLPTIEIIYAILFSSTSCGVGLFHWLFVDALFGFMAACSGIVAGIHWSPAFDRFRADHEGTMKLWKKARDEKWQNVSEEVHGIDGKALRQGAVAAVGCALVLVFLAFWGIVGAVDLFLVIFESCWWFTVLFSLFYVVIRLGICVALCKLVAHVVREVRKQVPVREDQSDAMAWGDDDVELEAPLSPEAFKHQLKTVTRVVDFCRDHWVALLVVPTLELVYAILWSSTSCGPNLIHWLAVDGLFGIMAVCSGLVAGIHLYPAYEKFHEDTVGTVQLWRKARDEGWHVTEEVHGVSTATFRQGAVALGGCAMVCIFLAIWGIVGAVDLFLVIFESCWWVTTVISLVFVVVRIFMLVALVKLVMYGVRQARQETLRSAANAAWA